MNYKFWIGEGMKNKMEEKVEKGLPSLEEFKALGTTVVSNMKQPVLASINLRNLKYFNEIYGFEKGDLLISLMKHIFCIENDCCVLGAQSYVDHLLLLCEAGDRTRDDEAIHFQKMADIFLERVNKEHSKAKVHVECGLYMLKPTDDFIYAQDNARYARRSLHGSYRNIVAWYSEDMRMESVKEASIIPSFENAMAKDEIQIYLQPKCSTINGKIIGAEALSRFCGQDGEEFSPAFYVPVLEQAGIVSKLDFQVFKKTVELLARWRDEGKEMFPISVNLSGLDFEEESFLDTLDAVVEEYQLDKQYIEFELTETVLVKDLDKLITTLKSLREKGYRIALDDFGSGYNSLYVLGQIPADVIKFDRGFVLHSIQDEVGMTILKNLVTTFQSIDRDVLFEGVETEQEKERIEACGCHIVQGYLYDKPLGIQDFEQKYVYAS